jgi:toxin ParE1/3/4
MTLDVICSPLALREINEIADYLARESNPRLGLRFLKAVEATCSDLAAMPEIAGRYESDNPRLADLRVWSVKDFPNHLIFYRVKPTSIEIVHVVYGGRDLENIL